MSSFTPHMEQDDDLFRGVIAWEQTPMHYIPNPDYNPSAPRNYHSNVNTWSPSVYVPTGDPDETHTTIIGPYSNTRPIKAYVTRMRKRNSGYKNIRVVRVEKVSGWKTVDND